MPYYTYIATNSGKNVLYTGISNNLFRRANEHAIQATSGFTSKYKVNRIIWYAVFATPREAIMAGKRIKGWTRAKKIKLIKDINPEFKDLLKY